MLGTGTDGSCGSTSRQPYSKELSVSLFPAVFVVEGSGLVWAGRLVDVDVPIGRVVESVAAPPFRSY